MSNNKIVLDLETQKAFHEVGGKMNLADLLVSVCGVYNYANDEFRAYEEQELEELEELIRQADVIIGFNHRHFDMPVLKPYLNGINILDLKLLDIMEELQKSLGYRVSLNSVARATLGAGKTGKGMDAIKHFKNGEMDKLKQYCLDDVKLTRDVYEFGLKNGFVKFKAGWGSYEVPVNFKL